VPVRIPPALGRKLIAAREALLLTPCDLASAAGLTPQTIYRLERCWNAGVSVRLRRTTLMAILSALNIPFAEFRQWAAEAGGSRVEGRSSQD